MSVDRDKLREILQRDCGEALSCHDLLQARPHLFSAGAVFLEEALAARMARVARAVENALALAGFREAALARAPDAARFDPGCRGAFVGFDFHLGEEWPQLIEINTNAGGALLNAKLARAMRGAPDDTHTEAAFVAMFREEWRLSGGQGPLRRMAIVDDAPVEQYLYPEFLLFRNLFRAHGIEAEVADPGALDFRDGHLWLGDAPCDLVYNRLTDFALEEPGHAALREAYLSGAVVVTPHPRAHALYADKRNLALLGESARLRAWGLGEDDIEALQRGVPATREVTDENAETLWGERRDLFFKPTAGYGSKGAYRGDKMTRRVWDEVRAGGYVAQRYVAPSRCDESHTDGRAGLKVDFRLYTYGGETQLIAARLYQGQTTNFRTPHGGFAPVRLVSGASGS